MPKGVDYYLGPHLGSTVKDIGGLFRWVRENPVEAATLAAENSTAGDVKLAIESALEGSQAVMQGDLGRGGLNFLNSAGGAAAAALPLLGAKAMGIGPVLRNADDLDVTMPAKLARPTARGADDAVGATDEASRTLLDKVRKEGGGSEGISAIFEETGDPLNSIADIYNLDTVRPSDVANVRGELGRITRESLSVLPDTITVYRGGNIRGELVPVTTSRDTARHFAKQSGEPLLEFQIPKSAVVADVKGILGSNASFLEGELLVRPSALRLPTDEASRMARAREMGFDVDGYHGTGGSDISEMKGTTWISETPALANEYAAMRGNMAGDFVGQVMPLKGKTGAVFNADSLPKTVTINHMLNEVLQQANDAGRKLSDEQRDRAGKLLEVVRKAAAREEAGPAFRRHDFWYESESLFGKDGAAAIKEIFDIGGFDSVSMKEAGQNTIGILDPKNIRSRFAKFDPAKKDSANILAGIGGAAVAGSALSEFTDEEIDQAFSEIFD